VSSEAIQVVVERRGEGNRLPEAKRSLSRAERRVLESICDPNHRNITVSERCKAIGIGESRYFEVVRDPWFRAQHREAVRRAVDERIASLVNASADTAAVVGRDGFNDRRMLLELTGHYVPRQQIDHTTAGQPIVGVVGVDPSQL
jgi:hypothetical protein